MFSDLLLCTASDIFRILAYSALCFFRYMLAYSIIFSVIKTYSDMLRHYWSIFRHIQAYSAPCVILAYSQLCHILNPDIFRTGGLFKILWNVDQAYSGPCTKGILQAYLDIFRILGNAYIRRTLAYLESWNIQNPSVIASRRIFRTLSFFENLRIFRTLTYLKPNTYWETSQRLKMEFFFVKIFKSYCYFSKAFHLRSLNGYWIRLSLNKYSLTNRSTWRYILYNTYLESCLLS